MGTTNLLLQAYLLSLAKLAYQLLPWSYMPTNCHNLFLGYSPNLFSLQKNQKKIKTKINNSNEKRMLERPENG